MCDKVFVWSISTNYSANAAVLLGLAFRPLTIKMLGRQHLLVKRCQGISMLFLSYLFDILFATCVL